MSKSSDREALAALMSTCAVQVTRVEAGVRTLNMTDREWYLATREPRPVRSVVPSVRLWTVDHLGREHYVNAEGEYLGYYKA